MRKYIVRLTAEERQKLRLFLRAGKFSYHEELRARILLKSDQSDGRDWMTDEEIARALDVVVKTVERTREKFVQEGFEACLRNPRRQKPPHNLKLDGELEAQILMVACSETPKGRSRWTLKLIADQLVELNLVEKIGRETVRRALKKTRSNPGRKSSGA